MSAISKPMGLSGPTPPHSNQRNHATRLDYIRQQPSLARSSQHMWLTNPRGQQPRRAARRRQAFVIWQDTWQSLPSCALPVLFTIHLHRHRHSLPKSVTSIFAMHSNFGSTSFSNSNSSSHEHMADQMELEAAAEALAGLAQVATLGSSESGTTKWGSKGKRARSGCQVKSESPQVDSPDLALNSSNYQVILEYDHAEETDIHERFKKAKIKQQGKLLSPNLTCGAITTAFGGSRSRKNLTEAEKEEKRLRRVLANRESARQTIRRRQALHEELSRKASDLSMENVDLKREKELALEKLQSLKSTNELLKTQMYQTVNPVREENFLQGVQNVKPKVREENLLQMSLNIKSEVDDNLDLKLANPNVSSPKNTLKVYCTKSLLEHSQLTPCLLPPIVQPLSSDKSAPMPCIPLVGSGLNSSDPKPYTINTTMTPVYLLPYPWFVPVPYHRGDDVQQDLSAVENGKQNTVTEGVSPNNGTVENDLSTLTLQAKAELSDSKENGPGTNSSSNRAPFLHMMSDGHGAGIFGGHATGSVQTLPPHTISEPSHVLSTGKHEPWIVQSSSQLGSRNLCSSSQLNEMPTLFFPIMIREHTVAAADARKRRKELTKFKNFTGRQYGLPC